GSSHAPPLRTRDCLPSLFEMVPGAAGADSSGAAYGAGHRSARARAADLGGTNERLRDGRAVARGVRPDARGSTPTPTNPAVVAGGPAPRALAFNVTGQFCRPSRECSSACARSTDAHAPHLERDG